MALVLLAWSGFAWTGAAAAATGGCKLARLAELPVTMIGSAPIVTAKINGVDASFIADSGAFYSMLSPAAAQQYQLHMDPAPSSYYIEGINGSARVDIATVKEFTLAGVRIKNVEFLVGGTDSGRGSVGLLGQNVFHVADVEYDLAHGVIRLMRAADCKNANLAYWISGTSSPYSLMDIRWSSRQEPHTVGSASLNGTSIRVMFDTGANSSFLSRRAAERAGINVEGPDATPGGESYGLGRGMIKTWIVPVQSFKLGDEEIRNTRLRVGDFNLQNADMLIGVDFFLSHRLYVATHDSKLFFTYNGGPVFNLSVRSKPSEAAPAGAEGTPTTAAEFARRGTAFASRQDFERAIVDLTRACELAPDTAEYFYERGLAHWQNKEPEAASSDFDRAIDLKPDHVPAHIARAELRASRPPPHAATGDTAAAVVAGGGGADGGGGTSAGDSSGDSSGVLADLDAADHAAAKEADVRFEMAILYARKNRLPQAVGQFNLWVAAHSEDARLPRALMERCWAKGLAGIDLKSALDDCNTAGRRIDKIGDAGVGVFDARGLVRLRLGDYDKAIGDFDAALKLQPHNAWPRYARGIAEYRRGKGGAGEDLAAATAQAPKIAEFFAAHGISP